jgi:hypothetical protein
VVVLARKPCYLVSVQKMKSGPKSPKMKMSMCGLGTKLFDIFGLLPTCSVSIMCSKILRCVRINYIWLIEGTQLSIPSDAL